MAIPLFYICPMDRLSIPSDECPAPARRAGLDRQFRYWRGASGRRYLFSAIPSKAVSNFRDAVVIFAEADGDGNFTGRALFQVGAGPEPDCPAPAPGEIVLVHLLSPSAASRRRTMNDLLAPRVKLAA